MPWLPAIGRGNFRVRGSGAIRIPCRAPQTMQLFLQQSNKHYYAFDKVIKLLSLGTQQLLTAGSWGNSPRGGCWMREARVAASGRRFTQIKRLVSGMKHISWVWMTLGERKVLSLMGNWFGQFPWKNVWGGQDVFILRNKSINYILWEVYSCGEKREEHFHNTQRVFQIYVSSSIVRGHFKQSRGSQLFLTWLHYTSPRLTVDVWVEDAAGQGAVAWIYLPGKYISFKHRNKHLWFPKRWKVNGMNYRNSQWNKNVSQITRIISNICKLGTSMMKSQKTQ